MKINKKQKNGDEKEKGLQRLLQRERQQYNAYDLQ